MEENGRNWFISKLYSMSYFPPCLELAITTCIKVIMACYELAEGVTNGSEIPIVATNGLF